MVSKEVWAGVGSALAFVGGLIAMAMNLIKMKLYIHKIIDFFSSTIHITFPEYTANHFERNELFVAIEAYISRHCIDRARKLRAKLGRGEREPHFFVDDEQEIIDNFEGTTLWWYAYTERSRSTVIIQNPGDDERRFYRVAFHRSFRDKVKHSYLPHVLEEGRAVIADNRQRRLFTNNPHGETWSHVAFQHPANFDTLAMDPREKQAIKDDLNAFLNGKEYYDQVGKAWKRGYLLFGPPGTGKSTMITAISNHLKYDIYDLELTAVKNNTELRKLFIQTKGKSIIVIEDIDRSVDFTGKRRDKKSGRESDNMKNEHEKEDAGDTKLTLSGMLNFIEGLWSACGGERIIIFTTNNKDKLDPALIRPGRMDKHIEMSYCRFEAFKVLATNYLEIAITEHHMFELFTEIGQLLEEVDMSPAEVAGYLMRREEDADARLKRLVDALKNTKGGNLANAARDKAKAKEEIVEIVHTDVGGSQS